MNQKILHTPEGLRDIYGAECESKLILEQRLGEVFSAYGYRDIETPAFEYFDVFGREIGTIPSKDLYKFFDREGNTLVLRPDFTPSIARAVSRYWKDSKDPVRLCYRGRTFINHSSLQGRLKENTQMGAELIGEGSVDADAEIIAMATEAMLRSGLKKFQISLSDVAFFESLVAEAAIDSDTVERLRELIRNHNTFGAGKLLDSLKIDPKISQILKKLPLLTGGEEILHEVLAMSKGLRAQEAVERLKDVLELLKLYGLSDYISFDFGMLSSYMYYTGIIFRGYTYGTGDAVVKGGRYDTLLAHFGKKAPSIGFVITIGTLMSALSRQNIEILPEKKRCLIVYGEGMNREAILKAQEYRAQGRCVEIMKLADDRTDEQLRESGGYDAVVRLKG